MKWTSTDLSSKLSLTYGGDVTYYKSVHYPIPIPLEFSKQISKLFFQLSVQIYSLLGQTEGKERPFLEGARRGPHCKIIRKSTWLS